MGLIRKTQPAAKPGAKQPDEVSYAKVVTAGFKYIATVVDQLLELVKSSKTPEDGLARATVLIMSALSEKSNNTIPQAVRIPAAKQIMGLIAELAEAAGLIKNREQVVNRAKALIGNAIMQAAQNPAQPTAPAGAQAMPNAMPAAQGAMPAVQPAMV